MTEANRPPKSPTRAEEQQRRHQQHDAASDATQRTHTPVVSVIVPAYNVSQFIAEALSSVLAQTFADYEIIVVNDGAPDTEELERVLEPYRERIVYLKQENRGLSGARNTAIRAARGEFIALLDADDMWEPDYLAVQVAGMRDDPETDVLYADAHIFGSPPLAGRNFMREFPSEGEVTAESLISQRCHVMICVTARRDTVVRVGMFDESLRSCEDFDLWVRIVKAGGRIRYHRRVLARYRYRIGSLSTDTPRMNLNLSRVLEKIEREMNPTPAEREAIGRLRERMRANVDLFEGKRAFFRGDAEAAVECLTRANLFFKSRKLALAVRLLRVAPHVMLRAYDLRDRIILKTNSKF